MSQQSLYTRKKKQKNYEICSGNKTTITVYGSRKLHPLFCFIAALMMLLSFRNLSQQLRQNHNRKLKMRCFWFSLI